MVEAVTNERTDDLPGLQKVMVVSTDGMQVHILSLASSGLKGPIPDAQSTAIALGSAKGGDD